VKTLNRRLPHFAGIPRPPALALASTVLAALACVLAPSAWAAGGGQIAGTVRSVPGGTPIEGIEVCAYTETSVDGGPLEGGAHAECVTTNVNGEYTISGLPAGKYEVEFSAPEKSTLNFVAQYYKDKALPSEAELVTVRESEKVSEINAELEEGGWITGTVTNASTTKPIDGIEVCAFSKHNFRERCASTNSEGEYKIATLASGEYAVVFAGGALNYVVQYYDDKTSFSEADAVRVTAKEGTPAINAQLAEGGEIKGRVTNVATNAAIEGIFVCAFTAGSEREIEGCATTGANGEYTIAGLPEGQYTVGFNGGTNYITQYYNDQYVFSEAQPIAVAVKSVVPGIDAAMERGPAKAPKNMGLPAVSGTPAVGSTLSCSTGSWSGAPTPTFTYQWLLGGTPIPGARSSIYQVVSADEGHSLACEVTATNVVKSANALSVAVAIPVAPPPPPPPPRPVITIASSNLVVAGHSKTLRVKLECRDLAACSGSVKLTVKVLTRRRKGKKTVSGRGSVVLARGSFSLGAGRIETIALRLTGTGRKLLAHAKRHPLSAKLVVALAGGATSTESVKVS
jgi:carboxypeptidase family protein